LSRAPWLRPVVAYGPALLNDYQPNRSFLLTDDQLKALEAAGTVEGVAQAKGKGKSYARILSSLLIDLTHASSNLENVNISWLDTKTLIELGERPEGLTEQQLRIVLNHKEAITFLKDHGTSLQLGKRDLFDIHSLVIKGLFADDSAVGALRSVVLRFDDSRHIPPDNPHQLRDIFDQFCEKANAIPHPFEQAFFVMTFLPCIQPFEDDNKRTSRLAMNIPFIRHSLAPFSFSDIKGRDYMFGLLAFYERGQHHFLVEAFTEAYQKSAARHRDLVAYVNDGGMLGTVSG
jgi:Fic family protein